jgi:hypothetical protein
MPEPVDALTLVVPTDDAAVVRRVKAIASTRPLHDLDRNKSSWDGQHWVHYDLLSLGLAVIDQVALAMGISAGILYDDAVRYVAEQAARQHPDGRTEHHRAVGERVIGGLVSDSPHEVRWVDHSGETPVRRVHNYRLLYEQWNADDTVHLRATEAAINVLIDALDIDDIESAQIAAETLIRSLVDRKAFRSAVQVARQARYRTIQYLERIRNIVRDTLIEPDAHDWAAGVPALLNAALDHVVSRIEAETALVQAVQDRRADAADVGARRTANELTAVLAECRSRHSDLQRHLLGARGQLRRAQDDHFSRPRVSLRRADIESDMVQRMLGAPSGLVAGFGEELLLRFAAPRQRYLPSGDDFLDELLEPGREPEEGVEVPVPIFDEEGSTPWWEPYWDAADAMVDGLAAPTRLATLLTWVPDVAAAACGVDGDPLDQGVLAAALCHIAHEHLATPLVGHPAGTRLICAVVTDEAVSHPLIDADDLLLIPAVTARDEVEHGAVAGAATGLNQE